jgi:hypothetical protein
MKQVKYKDWVFDIEKTQDYYKRKMILSDKSLLSNYPESMKTFLAQCGIDCRKPCSISKAITYCVYGTARSNKGYELDFYDNHQFASIMICLDHPFNNNFSFIMEIFF